MKLQFVDRFRVAVVVTVIGALGLAGAATARAADETSCARIIADSVHSVALGTTTCGTVDGVTARWTPLSSGWSVDSSNKYNHVNATIWYYGPPTAGNYDDALEMGYWRNAPGDSPYNMLNNCVYSIITRRNAAGNIVQDGYCLNNVGSTPTAATFAIVENPAGSSHYSMYLNGVNQLAYSYVLDSDHSHLVQAGMEQQASSLPSTSSQYSPTSQFTSLKYHSIADGTFKDWVDHTHCNVGRNWLNVAKTTYGDNGHDSFGELTFPTSFQSKIGPGAGTYRAFCDNSVPTGGRLAW